MVAIIIRAANIQGESADAEFFGGRFLSAISNRAPSQQALEQNAFPMSRGKSTLAIISCIEAPVAIPA